VRRRLIRRGGCVTVLHGDQVLGGLLDHLRAVAATNDADVFAHVPDCLLAVEHDYMDERARLRGVEHQRAAAADNARVIEEFLIATGLSATA
jgi:hypothetical protein